MKKVFAMLVVSSVLLIACDKEKVVGSDDLPANATGYITTHYPAIQIKQVVKERDDLKTYFHVYLENGSRLSFSRQGDIREIKGTTAIPDAILPALIVNYVTTNYPGAFIKEWERDDTGHEIKLSTNIKLEFDRNGNFLRIDD